QAKQGRPVSEAGIRKKAKQLSWQRDLSDEVRREVRARLQQESVREAVRKPNAHDVVQEAATEGVAVVKSHRKDITQLRGLQARLTDRVAEGLQEVEGAADALRRLGLTEDGEASADALVDRMRAAKAHVDTIGS